MHALRAHVSFYLIRAQTHAFQIEMFLITQPPYRVGGLWHNEVAAGPGCDGLRPGMVFQVECTLDVSSCYPSSAMALLEREPNCMSAEMKAHLEPLRPLVAQFRDAEVQKNEELRKRTKDSMNTYIGKLVERRGTTAAAVAAWDAILCQSRAWMCRMWLCCAFGISVAAFERAWGNSSETRDLMRVYDAEYGAGWHLHGTHVDVLAAVSGKIENAWNELGTTHIILDECVVPFRHKYGGDIVKMTLSKHMHVKNGVVYCVLYQEQGCCGKLLHVTHDACSRADYKLRALFGTEPDLHARLLCHWKAFQVETDSVCLRLLDDEEHVAKGGEVPLLSSATARKEAAQMIASSCCSDFMRLKPACIALVLRHTQGGKHQRRTIEIPFTEARVNKQMPGFVYIKSRQEFRAKGSKSQVHYSHMMVTLFARIHGRPRHLLLPELRMRLQSGELMRSALATLATAGAHITAQDRQLEEENVREWLTPAPNRHPRLPKVHEHVTLLRYMDAF